MDVVEYMPTYNNIKHHHHYREWGEKKRADGLFIVVIIWNRCVCVRVCSSINIPATYILIMTSKSTELKLLHRIRWCTDGFHPACAFVIQQRKNNPLAKILLLKAAQPFLKEPQTHEYRIIIKQKWWKIGFIGNEFNTRMSSWCCFLICMLAHCAPFQHGHSTAQHKYHFCFYYASFLSR